MMHSTALVLEYVIGCIGVAALLRRKRLLAAVLWAVVVLLTVVDHWIIGGAS